MITRVCRGCEGPLCPTCGGCIQEGECGCFETWEENPVEGLSEEEIERRESRHVRELRAQRDALLTIAETIESKIDQKMIDYWGPNAIHNIPLTVQEIEALRAAIAKAKGEAPQ